MLLLTETSGLINPKKIYKLEMDFSQDRIVAHVTNQMHVNIFIT